MSEASDVEAGDKLIALWYEGNTMVTVISIRYDGSLNIVWGRDGEVKHGFWRNYKDSCVPVKYLTKLERILWDIDQ